MKRSFEKGVFYWCICLCLGDTVAATQSAPDAALQVVTALYKDAVVNSVVKGSTGSKSSSRSVLHYLVSVPPAHGKVTIGDAGKDEWVYRPESSYAGYDEFRVMVSDGHTQQATRIVISFNVKPTRRTYFVDAARGNDGNPGSALAPFATIQAAHDVTCPGDTVLIRNGTYLQRSGEGVVVIKRSGLPGAMITYKAYPGEHPVLHAATAWNHILVMASYIRIEGLEIAGNAGSVPLAEAAAVSERFSKGKAYQTFGPETSAYETNGISIRPEVQNAPADRRFAPRHLEIVGNHIHDVQGGGLSAMFADYVLFEKNVIHDTSYRAMYATSGISVLGSQNTDNETPAYKVFILGNLLYRNRAEVKWADKKAMSDGNGIIIDSNRNKGDATGAYVGRMLIANNVVYENGGAGIQVFSSDNVMVLHNTVVHNSLTPGLNYGQIWVHQAANVLVANNIAVAGDGEGGKINQLFKDTMNVVYDYNLYFGGKKPEIMGPHDRIADPRFKNVKPADFHPDTGSPAIGAGNSKLSLLRDFDGRERPRNSQPDDGALQH